jgi:hypothetical protein
LMPKDSTFRWRFPAWSKELSLKIKCQIDRKSIDRSPLSVVWKVID